MTDDKPTPGGDGSSDVAKEGAGGEAPSAETTSEKAATTEKSKGSAGGAEKEIPGAAAKAEPDVVIPTHNDAMDDPDVSALAGAVSDSVVSADEFAGDVTITVAADTLIDSCRYLKDELEYSFLVDLTAVDWPEREEGRFDVIYWMHRFSDSKRLRLRAVLPESEPIASVTGVWKAANWMEREAYDMFGIIFDDHPGLERILMWEGFNGHPLRKDFPVEGIDTGAAIYPDVYPPGGGPVREDEIEKPEPKPEKKPKPEAAEDKPKPKADAASTKEEGATKQDAKPKPEDQQPDPPADDASKQETPQ